MKSINLVYTLIGIVILGLLIWFIVNQVNKNKMVVPSSSKGVNPPTCVYTYPNGETVMYPCGTVPPPQTNRVAIVPPANYVNPELIRVI